MLKAGEGTKIWCVLYLYFPTCCKMIFHIFWINYFALHFNIPICDYKEVVFLWVSNSYH